MGKVNNDIYGNVIQNAKDIKDLQFELSCQNSINNFEQKRYENTDKRLHSQSIAGKMLSISVMLLGGVVMMLSSTINRMNDRIEKLEEEAVIDIAQ